MFDFYFLLRFSCIMAIICLFFISDCGIHLDVPHSARGGSGPSDGREGQFYAVGEGEGFSAEGTNVC